MGSGNPWWAQIAPIGVMLTTFLGTIYTIVRSERDRDEHKRKRRKR